MHTGRERLEAMNKLADLQWAMIRLYRKSMVGGVAHVVTDDGNVQDEHIESCLRKCGKEHGEEHEVLTALLAVPLWLRTPLIDHLFSMVSAKVDGWFCMNCGACALLTNRPGVCPECTAKLLSRDADPIGPDVRGNMGVALGDVPTITYIRPNGSILKLMPGTWEWVSEEIGYRQITAGGDTVNVDRVPPLRRPNENAPRVE